MFSSLRQGSPLYILDKDALTLKVGTVESAPQVTFNQWIPNMPPQPMDVLVKFDNGTTSEFKQMQPNMSVAVYGNVLVAETRELMLQEVEQMIRQSQKQIESVPYHQKVIESCKGMMKSLSPMYAKEQATDEEIANMKADIGEIKKLLMKMSSPDSSKK